MTLSHAHDVVRAYRELGAEFFVEDPEGRAWSLMLAMSMLTASADEEELPN